MSQRNKDGFNVKVLELNDNKAVVLLDNIPVTLANSIRRIILTDIPTLAIERVFIFRNDSLMNDEMLAHRLGLIPLKTPVGKYGFPGEECEGEECKPEYVSLSLSIAAGDSSIIVLSSDIKSSDPDVKPVYDGIEIVKLTPGQGIEIEMWAYMGRGRDHAKWTPVSIAVVRGLPVIKILEPNCEGYCEKCIESCPKKILYSENGMLKIKDIYKCTTCKLCEEACPNNINVDIDESSSILYFEAIGQLTPKEILSLAFDELIKKIDDFYSSFSEVRLEDVEA